MKSILAKNYENVLLRRKHYQNIVKVIVRVRNISFLHPVYYVGDTSNSAPDLGGCSQMYVCVKEGKKCIKEHRS